jgi:hypothetical protein
MDLSTLVPELKKSNPENGTKTNDGVKGKR